MKTYEKYRPMAPAVSGWLLTQAHNRTTVNYLDVSDFTAALGHRVNCYGRAMGCLLFEVALFCHDNRLPNVTAMIVNKSNGDVSPGYWWIAENCGIPLQDPKIEQAAIQAWVANDLASSKRIHDGLEESE